MRGWVDVERREIAEINSQQSTTSKLHKKTNVFSEQAITVQRLSCSLKNKKALSFTKHQPMKDDRRYIRPRVLLNFEYKEHVTKVGSSTVSDS
eukprot:scaffold51445_cov38-Cyclotella_meneghiniana.AAC.7